MVSMLRSIVRTGGLGFPSAAPAAPAASCPSSPAAALATSLRPLQPQTPLANPCSAFPRHTTKPFPGPPTASPSIATTTTAAAGSNGGAALGLPLSRGSLQPGGLRPHRCGGHRGVLTLPAGPPPLQSTGGNGQVGPPPARKPHTPKAPGEGARSGKAAGGGGGLAAESDQVDDYAADDDGGAGDAGLEELEAEAEQQLAPYMDTVFKVYCMHTEPNYSLPWQRKRQYSSSSSGFVVEYSGRTWLLTNAHSVDYHTQVKVKRRGDDRKFLARVISLGVDCDIAALEVDDPDFWAPPTEEPTTEPTHGSVARRRAAAAAPAARPVLQLGPLPRLQDGVAVVGYPVGGDTISVTAGVVSRIEVTDYSHGSTDLLAIQIDAAINGGNSGGPVFNSACQCVGIAFQALTGSDVENVGYVIPTPVVTHFLEDYLRTATFSGFPALGLQWQRLESDALRRAYGMPPGAKGVLVRAVNPTSAAAGVLAADDVLLSFDGTPISNDGTVPFRTGERISFSHLVTSKFVGDVAEVEVLRGGERLKLQVKLSKPATLVPPHLSNTDPPYLLVGGLVFTTVCEPYLQSEYGAEYGSDAPVKLLDRLYHGLPTQPDEEVVVLSQVLACDVTLGYEDVVNVQLRAFNGAPVTNLAGLAAAVRQALAEMEVAEAAGRHAGFLRFDLEYNEVVVLEAADVRRVTPEVMRSHSIPYDMSADLRGTLVTSDG